jgi:hypothetical protein
MQTGQAALGGPALYQQLAKTHGDDAVIPGLAMALGVLARALAGIEHMADAVDAGRKSLEHLAPFVERYPKVFAGKCAAISREYRENCRRAQMHPDAAVLNRVVRSLDGWGGEGGAELVDEGGGESHRLGPARHVLQTADRRLRAQRRTALGCTADGHLQQRIVLEAVEVVAVLVAAADRQHAHLDQLHERMLDAGGIAQVADAAGKPRADAKTSLRLAQQQQTPVGGLIAACEIDCELLARDGWKIEGKKRIVIHGGVACGRNAKHSVWQRIATRSQRPAPHSPAQFSPLMHRSG